MNKKLFHLQNKLWAKSNNLKTKKWILQLQYFISKYWVLTLKNTKIIYSVIIYIVLGKIHKNKEELKYLLDKCSKFEYIINGFKEKFE